MLSPSLWLKGRRMQFDRLKRRQFITLLGGAAITWPLVAQGQEPGRIYRLGALLASPRDAPHYVILFDERRRLGFIEGRNLVIDAGVLVCRRTEWRSMRPIW